MGKPAVFDVIKATPEYIFIQDIGHEADRTVTNDVEWVLEEVEGRRVVLCR